jgi:hypothetical protein
MMGVRPAIDAAPPATRPVRRACGPAQTALPPGTTYLLVEIYAFEDVRNDAVLPEFDGHYADDISLVLVRN